jgi:dihydrofolate reductase
MFMSLDGFIAGPKRAAGDKNVLVHGAGTAQLALAAGVLDEIEIHLIPVLRVLRSHGTAAGAGRARAGLPSDLA